MSFSALAATQVPVFKPAAAPPAASADQLTRIRRTAKDFESQLIGQMLQPMFDGLSTNGEFDGGEAEGTYRSFMTDALGKQMSRSGRGIGVAPMVEREMLKMQGLSEPTAS